MIKNISYLVVVMLLISCGNKDDKGPKKPDNLISKNKMANIIYDMSILSAAKGVNKKLMEKQGVRPEDYVYTKYSIDSAQFAKSNAYYAFDIETYQDIYESVNVMLEKDKNEFSELVRIENKERDSLNKEQRILRDSLRKQRELNGTKLGNNRRDIIPIGRVKNTDSLMKLKNRQ